MHARPTPLAVDRLRALTLDASAHPRGQPHLSAASGLVCAHGRAYVIGDDEQHLALYRNRAGEGELHRLVGGNLPRDAAARKRRKPDFEALALLPGGELMALGSGSRPTRERGVVVAINARGTPRSPGRVFGLAPTYAALRRRLGSLNIEGAFVLGRELVLLQRGHAGAPANLAVHYRLRDWLTLVAGQGAALQPLALRGYGLGHIDGVPLAFTDGCALPGGGWAFSAVAEDSTGSYADGPCLGSAVGVVGRDGALKCLRRLATPDKVEGVAVLGLRGGRALFMVSDADDPAVASCLSSTWL